jgi:hypothetical protein
VHNWFSPRPARRPQCKHFPTEYGSRSTTTSKSTFSLTQAALSGRLRIKSELASMLRKKLSKAMLTFMICLISCSVGSMEFSEFPTLRDDTSNDFSMQFFAESLQIETFLTCLCTKTIRSAAIRHLQSDDEPGAQSVPVASQDSPHGVLHLSPLLRT